MHKLLEEIFDSRYTKTVEHAKDIASKLTEEEAIGALQFLGQLELMAITYDARLHFIKLFALATLVPALRAKFGKDVPPPAPPEDNGPKFQTLKSEWIGFELLMKGERVLIKEAFYAGAAVGACLTAQGMDKSKSEEKQKYVQALTAEIEEYARKLK